jgi:hypothetical protein
VTVVTYDEPAGMTLEAGDLLSFPFYDERAEDHLSTSFALVIVGGTSHHVIRLLLDDGKVCYGGMGAMKLIRRLGDV